MVRPEAVVQQSRGGVEAVGAGRCAQYHRDEGEAVPGGAGRDADACAAGGAGLEAGDPLIPAEELIRIDQLGRPAPEGIRPDAGVVQHLSLIHISCRGGACTRRRTLP